MTDEPPRRKKGIYIGAPACFLLELEGQKLRRAFCTDDPYDGLYVVGSALERADWRDVDVRLMLHDDGFAALFPDAGQHWEFDARWLIMTCAISAHLSRATGLPIDFQFQPTSHANERHKGSRNALGLTFMRPEPD